MISDASIVYVTRMTMAPVGSVVYHLPRGWGEWTRCGRRISTGSPRWESLMVPIRRDVARYIGRLCGICGARR